MDRNQLDGLLPFLAVAEHLSFTRAARVLNVSPTAVSKSVQQLEHRHGVTLFQRTTRSVALTEPGLMLFERTRHAVSDIDNALTLLSGYQVRPTGTLRLTMTRMAMTLLVEPHIPEFRERYPDVTLELSLNEGTVDLASGRYDAGIRQQESLEKDMVTVRLTPPIRWSVIGSPEYFARHGQPSKPEDLTMHQGILYRFVTSGQQHRWEFMRRSRDFSVNIGGRIVVNDRSSLLSLARRGVGLAYMADFEAADDLASGRLKSVLRDYIRPTAGLHLYFPSRAQVQPTLRAFIDVIRQSQLG
jgi:DNA-binding transcriptional LysR family regulator